MHRKIAAPIVPAVLTAALVSLNCSSCAPTFVADGSARNAQAFGARMSDIYNEQNIRDLAACAHGLSFHPMEISSTVEQFSGKLPVTIGVGQTLQRTSTDQRTLQNVGTYQGAQTTAGSLQHTLGDVATGMTQASRPTTVSAAPEVDNGFNVTHTPDIEPEIIEDHVTYVNLSGGETFSQVRADQLTPKFKPKQKPRELEVSQVETTTVEGNKTTRVTQTKPVPEPEPKSDQEVKPNFKRTRTYFPDFDHRNTGDNREVLSIARSSRPPKSRTFVPGTLFHLDVGYGLQWYWIPYEYQENYFQFSLAVLTKINVSKAAAAAESTSGTSGTPSTSSRSGLLQMKQVAPLITIPAL